jgi:CRP-like cAMP-binding protein
LLLSARDQSRHVYVVQSGRLRVTIFSVEGREVTMRDLEPGNLFGELAAVDGSHRSASVIAAMDSILLAVDDESFRRAVLEDPAATAWFMTHLAALVRQMTNRLYEQTLLSVRTRLLSHISRLCLQSAGDDNVAHLWPAPTHEELAMRVGTHRETVSRELSALARDGLVRLSHRRIDIPDVARLVRAALDAAA